MRVSRMLKVDGLPFPRRRNASKYEKLASCFLVIVAIALLWIQGTSGEDQPNVTTVETWGETQIKVTWQPYEHAQSSKPHHYELHIDDHLEYFGNDVMYVARRLTPDTIYHFKLRWCIEDTNQCSQFSKTLPGVTARSQKRGYIRSFLQWTLLLLIATVLACSTALIGLKIYRKLWRSFLYRYDYRSETTVGLPKYLATTDVIDDDTRSTLCVETSPETDKEKSVSSILHGDSRKVKHPDRQEVQPNEPLMVVEDHSNISPKGSEVTVDNCYTDRHPKTCEFDLQSSEDCVEETFAKNKDNSTNENNSKNTELSKNIDQRPNKENLCNIYFGDADKLPCTTEFLHNEKIQKTTPGNGEDQVIIKSNSLSPKIIRFGRMSDKKLQKSISLESQLKFQSENLEKYHNSKNIRHDLIPNGIKSKPVIDNKGEIVVVVDNSNIFIGAQECASLLNPKERRRNIRVKIQQLVKVFERGRTLCFAFVQGSSPPTTEQVWEVYRRLGYCVDLEDRRGKDEQRVDEGLHLHIYKALCELSPRKLVIASGDGNKGKSEGATSFPGCAQAALEKGWLVEVHSWQHSLSTEWLKLSRKYPVLLTIHYLDRYINHITFVDGKHGRKCQPFPTGFFKN